MPIPLEILLEEGETLGDAPPITEDDSRLAYRYNWFPIIYSELQGDVGAKHGNGVVLVAEPGGMVEPVKLTTDKTLFIEPLHGRGRLLLVYPELGVLEEHILDSDKPAMIALIGRGALYCYENDGETELVIRDDSMPAFEEGDETIPTPEELRQFYAAFSASA